ncbi:ssDNA endodeoxyribonuclease [Orbilia oligospora]|nr:ssDNA endodeoxyribonuclease [Orbilia oligospora]KAF3239831.1 ssDNA endodeoxyribonuclease [Orbilia oligospora]KAF3260101.1 ssDNA endodeoxyribonuclease [Orbilia oligospora]KAF3280315.1 ssDNA endodeoxyribonuclease [Orbilia oligospora]
MTQDPTPSAAAGPVFSAISSSTRHIYDLLKCIGFMPIASVSISADNIRFSVEDSHSMQANVCLTPDLFSSYNYTPSTIHLESAGAAPPSSAEQFNLESEENNVKFQISLSALLECLQIFGADGSNNSGGGGGGGGGNNNNRQGGTSISGRENIPFGRQQGPFFGNPNLFEQNGLRLPGTCRFVYQGDGFPLSIILEDSGVTTTCHLTTFIPQSSTDLIPFNRTTLTHKIILKSAFLHDALLELDHLSPETLIYSVSPHKRPNFSLSATGILSSATVDFSSNNKFVMETFLVNEGFVGRYKFGLVRKAMRAMGVASKVSLRGDGEGVLSMQYLVEVGEKGAAPTFIDFRFLPLNHEEDYEDEEGGEVYSGMDGAEEEEDGDEMME